MISELNNGGWPPPEPQRVYAMFESQVKLSADAVAVMDGVEVLWLQAERIVARQEKIKK